MHKKILYILVIILAFALSCTEENDSPLIFTGHDYYPLTTGNSITYKITEITIDKPSNIYDTSTYYIQEIVDIKIIDNEGDSAYRLERFYRISESDTWIIHSVWATKLTDATAEKVEENRRIVKIRFPAKEGLSWNGNLFNDDNSKDYRISAINDFFEIGEYAFDSCLTIVQDSSSSLIHKDLSYEVYALHKGLIYKEETYLNSQEVIYDVPIEERVTTGTIYIQELISIEQN